jgi:hypothetical protein
MPETAEVPPDQLTAVMAMLGRNGGKSRSKAKREAAKANGKCPKKNFAPKKEKVA